MRLPSLVCLAVMFALVLSHGRAVADGDKESARELFTRGQTHFKLSEYEEALALFRKAYRAKPDPALLFNIAQCHRLMGDREEAITFYRRFARDLSDSPQIAQAEDWIRRLTLELEERKQRTEGTPPAPTPLPLSVVPATPTPNALLITRPEARPAASAPPVYTRWWFWTGIAVVAGAVVTAVLVSRPKPGPDCLGIRDCGAI